MSTEDNGRKLLETFDSGVFENSFIDGLRNEYTDQLRTWKQLYQKYLIGYSIVEWEVKYFDDFSILEDKVLPPMKISRLREIEENLTDREFNGIFFTANDQKDLLQRHLSIAFGNFGLMKIRNIFLVVMETLPAEMRQDFVVEGALGRLRYYLEFLNKHNPNGDYEPFIERSEGVNIQEMVYDTECVKRVMCCINILWWRMNGILLNDGEILLEALDLFLINGGKANSVIKDNVAPLLFGSFSLSTEGKATLWTEVGDGLVPSYSSLIDFPSGEEVFKKQYDNYQKSMKELEDYGFKKLKTKIEWLFSAPLSEAEIADYGSLFQINGFYGYNRSNMAAVSPAQIKPKTEFTKEGAETLSRLVERKWDSIFADYPIEFRDASNEDWLKDLPTYMTGRSGGLKKETISTSMDGYSYRLSSNAKNFLFSLDPMRYLNFEDFKNALTIDNPGITGTRFTVERNGRTIMVEPLTVYVIETIGMIAPYVVGRQRDEYYFGEATGSTIVDNSLVLTTMGLGRFIYLASDISQLDISLRMENMRIGVIRAFEKFFAISPSFQEPMGPGWVTGEGSESRRITRGEAFIMTLRKLTDSYYIMGDRKVHRNIGVGSGEKGTAVLDSVATHACIEITVGRIGEFGGTVPSIFRQQYLGDDSLLLLEYQQWNQGEANAILDAFANVPQDMGMLINPGKTGVSPRVVEFLKVIVVLGKIAPRITNLQVFSGEKRSGAAGPIEVLIGFHSLLQKWVARGGNRYLSRKLIHIVASVMLRLKLSKGQGLFNLNMGILYVPKHLGGVGMLWRGFEMANCDVLVPFYPENVLKQVIEASTCVPRKGELAVRLAKALLYDRRSEPFGIINYRNQLRDGQIVKIVQTAMAGLEENGERIPRSNYFTIPEETVIQTLKGQKVISHLAAIENEKCMYDIKSKKICRAKDWEKLLSLTDKMELERTDEVVQDVWSDFPIGGVEVFKRFKYLYIRTLSDVKFTRMVSRVRAYLSRSGIDQIFSARMVISLIMESKSYEIAVNKILCLGPDTGRLNVVGELVSFVFDQKDDVMNIMESDLHSTQDAILSEFRVGEKDLDRFLIDLSDGSKGTGDKKIKIVAMLYVAILSPELNGGIVYRHKFKIKNTEIDQSI